MICRDFHETGVYTSCRGELESDSVCGKDAVVNTGKVICIMSVKKEIMVPGCSDVLKGGAGSVVLHMLLSKILMRSLPGASGLCT